MPDPMRPQKLLQAPHMTPPLLANATWKPMTRGLRPATSPTSTRGVDLVPAVAVARGPAAAADPQAPVMGTCAPAPAVARSKKRAQCGPSNAACSARMRAISTNNVNTNHL